METSLAQELLLKKSKLAKELRELQDTIDKTIGYITPVFSGQTYTMMCSVDEEGNNYGGRWLTLVYGLAVENDACKNVEITIYPIPKSKESDTSFIIDERLHDFSVQIDEPRFVATYPFTKEEINLDIIKLLLIEYFKFNS